MDRLKHLKKDVKRKLDLAQVQQMRPKEEVLFWIQSVEAMEGQVNQIVEEGTQQISHRCISDHCPKNCCSSYKVGKRVAKRLTAVEGLRSTGNFSDVADILLPGDVEALPNRPTVGMDSMFEKVWRCLTEEDEEWNHAITILKKSASEILGMDDEVLPLLKFSYDSLPNGEGFIEEFDDMNEALNQGHHIIGTLKQACLLESGTNEYFFVKMHDIIRDLALWIACECGKRKEKLLVKAGVGLIEAPGIEKWEEAERISLMRSDIRALFEKPTCLNLINLLLNNNRELERISNGFFKSMTCLRVLDLSMSLIEEFPMEITELVELHYLNLSHTPIKKLPGELKNLVKLKYFDLKGTTKLTMIPLKVISRLPRLQVLNLFDSRFWDLEVESWGGDNLREFEFLKHLKALGITIRTVSALQGLLNSQVIKSCLDLEELTVREEENDFFSSLEKLHVKDLPKLKMVRAAAHHSCFQNLSDVFIKDCDALKDLTWLLGLQSLRKLHISSCKGIEEVICGGVEMVKEELATFSRLRESFLRNLPKLKSIYRHALPFLSLEMIDIYGCPELKKLPLDSNSAKNTSMWIRGEKQWWDRSSGGTG
ncbi:hypothetical protein HHK36_022420 [Tetracentron sinense]|uniref:Disease resistance R13L4/SHOC-2-like LRR domain-containing protein n=1 Tax=Tetracentron sinense TaxID=13715 RepID=A0A834YMW8_TETSI|nr:hypothetical protein HHK36_022420 [Tetracentron sinense]